MDERSISEAAEGFAARYVATHFATRPELHCMRVGFAAGVEWHRQQAAAAESQALRDIAKMPMTVVDSPIDDSPPERPTCICHRCIEENKIMAPGSTVFLLNTARMILCPTCGNKRCPKASDHRLDCTGSNKSGQPGSIYGRYEDPIILRNADHRESE